MAQINGLDAGQDLASIFDNWGATSDKGLLKEREKRLAGTLTPELYAAFGNIAREGIYGSEGISKILNARRAAQALRTRQLSRGLRSTLGRRLGSRSGAVDTLIANQVQAPGMADQQAFLSDLMAKNLASRTYGLEGKSQLLGQLQQGIQNQWWKSGTSGSGALDMIGAAVDIGSLVAAPFTGGASLAATGSISNNPAALTSGNAANRGYKF